MSVSVEHLFVERKGVRLAGSLWTPASPPTSVIVMHPGSGPSDRNNDVLFPPIRNAMLEAGHAVASFDKRGVGESTGSLWTSSIEQQAHDLIACVDAVRRRVPGVPVGAFGHSQGGWVVHEAAGTAGVFDFAISNSGPAVSPADQERHALMRATDGHDDQPGTLALFDELLARVRQRQPLAEVVDQVDLDRVGSWSGFAAGLLDNPDEWDLASLLMSFDPSRALAAIDVPLLAVFGANDPIVPVEASVDTLHHLIDDDLLTVVVLDGGGHRLERGDDEGFVDGYLDTILQFVDDCSRPHRLHRDR